MVVLLPNFVVSISTKTKIDISRDQSALKALKVHVVTDPQMILKTKWFTATSIYLFLNNLYREIPLWFDSFPKLQYLSVSSNNLAGEIPSNMFDHLPRLQQLYLEGNKLSGKIPLGLFKCKELEYISLADNRLEGILPKEIGNLTMLRNLYLDNNLFEGEIPSNMFDHLPRLQQLYLEGNKLSEKIPLGLFKCKELVFISLADNRLGGILPKEIGNLTMLTKLYLYNNLFEGEIPSNMFDRLPRLQELYLEGNKLFGKIPLGLFKCKELEYISLADNRFEGILPKEIGNLTMLRNLYLYNNLFEGEIPSNMFDHLPGLQQLYLEGNKLSSKIPLGLFKCKELAFISLADNRLEGILPKEIGNLKMLRSLYLDNNLFEGEIPSNMFDHLPRLQQLYLKGNKLSGKIPLGLFKCKELEDICFSSNRLEGILPKEIGNLTMLKTLYLDINLFEGEIPSDMFDHLSRLQVLFLGENKLSGKIPLGLFKCKELEDISLAHNRLEGILPNEIGNLTTLKSLYLDNNLFEGHIPITLGNLRYLKALDIANNDLSSTLSSSRSSFLSALANCSDLAYLSFARNPLISGYLPASIGNLSVSLLYFDASSCSISGRIPGEIGNWNPNNKLRYLALNENQLEGILPLSLINCSELVLLNVANNNLSDTFPHWLGMLPKLQALILRSNRFHGSIQVSSTTFSFSRLQMVDLSHNDFTGLLPTEFFQNLKALKEEVGHEYDLLSYSVLLTIKGLVLEFKIKVLMPIFTSIDLSDNGFHGEIPKAVGELRMLHALNLSSNCLTGPIPTSFGKLTALESLDLSFNKLSGRIPSELTNLTFLEVLRLSNNNLIGPIPSGKQFDTFEDDSYLGNLGLCGLPLPKDCNNDEIPEPAQDEKDHGNGIAFIWKLAMMGYGCGMVLGISMAYIVFTTGRPWWLVRMIERDLRNKVSSWFGKKRK
ncbi:receptor-like protein 53 [Gossypium hirsutum]|uniref:Receptor-like protein 53 n=1 Tax=Gossypium hirsutum TaxID=3635 RepID=A0ABM2YVA1_GOSHI|nr:receptor-like protein 53 [Gossypium hirsutum]